MRDMVPITDLSTQNCLYEAWLHQISNSDFMYNPDSGEPYTPLDLRMQLLYNMAVDYENYYPQVKMHLEIPYKLWIMKQLSEQTPSDMVAVTGLRHMFQVSTNLKLFLLFSDHRRMFHEDLAALFQPLFRYVTQFRTKFRTLCVVLVPNSDLILNPYVVRIPYSVRNS